MKTSLSAMSAIVLLLITIFAFSPSVEAKYFGRTISAPSGSACAMIENGKFAVISEESMFEDGYSTLFIYQWIDNDLTLINSLPMPSGYYACRGIKAYDFNWDGRVEFAVIYSENSNGNKGGVIFVDSFGKTSEISTGYNPDGITLLKIEGYGTGFAVSNKNADFISVYQYIGYDSFKLLKLYVPKAGYNEINAADINNDGREDIVFMPGMIYSNPDIWIFEQQTDGSFTSGYSRDIWSDRNADGLAVGDFDFDYQKEVAVTDNWGSNIAIWDNLDGVLSPTPMILLPEKQPSVIECGDIDSNGYEEVIYQSESSKIIVAPLFQGKNNETYKTPFGSTTINHGGMVLGFIDEDWQLDVLIVGEFGGYILLSTDFNVELDVSTPPSKTVMASAQQEPFTTIKVTAFDNAVNYNLYVERSGLSGDYNIESVVFMDENYNILGNVKYLDEWGGGTVCSDQIKVPANSTHKIIIGANIAGKDKVVAGETVGLDVVSAYGYLDDGSSAHQSGKFPIAGNKMVMNNTIVIGSISFSNSLYEKPIMKPGLTDVSSISLTAVQSDVEDAIFNYCRVRVSGYGYFGVKDIWLEEATTGDALTDKQSPIFDGQILNFYPDYKSAKGKSWELNVRLSIDSGAIGFGYFTIELLDGRFKGDKYGYNLPSYGLPALESYEIPLTAKISISPSIWDVNWQNIKIGRIAIKLENIGGGGYNVNDVDQASLHLNDVVVPKSVRIPPRQTNVLEMTFARNEAVASLPSTVPGTYEVEVTGRMYYGTPFVGTAEIILADNSRRAKIAPSYFCLRQNFPNPFNPITSIAYDLPEASEVALTIYNVTGQQVATLVSAHQEAGHYEVAWDGSGFANGVYFYRIATGGEFSETKQMVLLK